MRVPLLISCGVIPKQTNMDSVSQLEALDTFLEKMSAKDSCKRTHSQEYIEHISFARMDIKYFLEENLQQFGVHQITAIDMRTLPVFLSLTSSSMSASICSKTHQKIQGRRKLKRRETSTAMLQTQLNQDQA